MTAKKVLLNQIVEHASHKYDANDKDFLYSFIGYYFLTTDYNDLKSRDPDYFANIAIDHFKLAKIWRTGYKAIELSNKNTRKSKHTSTFRNASPLTQIKIVTRNIPFLIDTISMELKRLEVPIRFILHPLIFIIRDKDRNITQINKYDNSVDERLLESLIYIETDPIYEKQQINYIHKNLNRVLEDARVIDADRPLISNNINSIIQELYASTCHTIENEIVPAIRFLEWLDKNNFIFVGYKRLQYSGSDDRLHLLTVKGSECGAIQEDKNNKQNPEKAQSLSTNNKSDYDRLLIITKSTKRSTVHRASHLDFISIKQLSNKCEIIGEHRFFGLFDSMAYMETTDRIPIINSKIDEVISRSQLVPNSYSRKSLLNILNNYPRDELFQADVDHLYFVSMEILRLQERQEVLVFIRRDPFDRYLTCTVFIPKERFSSEVRIEIQNILMSALNGYSVDFTTTVSESVYAQIYIIIHTNRSNIPSYDPELIKERIKSTTLSWTDKLHNSLLEYYKYEKAEFIYNKYKYSFPPAYTVEHSTDAASQDIKHIETSISNDNLDLFICHDSDNASGLFTLKLFKPGQAVSLSEVLPVLENMGLFIISERPYKVCPYNGPAVWVYVLNMKYYGRHIKDISCVNQLFKEAFNLIWAGHIENDGFNRLVLNCEINAHQANIIRAYSKYIHQLGSLYSELYLQDTLNSNPDATNLLVKLFLTKFDPYYENNRASKLNHLNKSVASSLDKIESLDEDRIFLYYYNLISATTRTNYFQSDKNTSPKNYLSLKIEPQSIPGISSTTPKYEIFIYSPRVEGIHLRGGKVARGGIRWSERRDDYRTEVLGLMKSQMVKNAVIVPAGAKGCFYPKRLPKGDNLAILQEAVECYKIFIRGLLDITDNKQGDNFTNPPRLLNYDGEDSYLVVAADKGTATFSDIANKISSEYGFWLRDAFASGGSHGYDHKKMGITARGTWEAVKHHFQILNLDPDNHIFSVIGIGDMGGDVFGNGMLLSDNIRLVGAFNHTHIFIDPNPDTSISFNERKRLFDTPGSTWDDYNLELISKGGGVYSRSTKAIRLSREAGILLDTDIEEATPDEIIKFLLQSKVDVIWNGGIGTFIKADNEDNYNVRDKTNDQIRIDSSDLNCRIFAEGGNLGITQTARIDFSKRGGLVNADWIDNSGGVDCSDREVNIKILLNKLVERGVLELKERNTLLRRMTDCVSDLVLKNNYNQVRAITFMSCESRYSMNWYGHIISRLEEDGELNRREEYLPDLMELDDRTSQGLGLTRPEISVLLAYTKTYLYKNIINSELPKDSFLHTALRKYFPAAVSDKYDYAIAEHPLRYEIISNIISNEIVNSAGVTFAHRLSEETGHDLITIVKAYIISINIFNMPDLWRDIDKLNYQGGVSYQVELHLATHSYLRHITRWFVLNSRYLDDIGNTILVFSNNVLFFQSHLRSLVPNKIRLSINKCIKLYRGSGLSNKAALKFSLLPLGMTILEITNVAQNHQHNFDFTTKMFFIISDYLKIYQLYNFVESIQTDNIWQERACITFIQEINEIHSELVKHAIEHYHEGDTAEITVRKWLAVKQTTFEYYNDFYRKISLSGDIELSMLTVTQNILRKFMSI